MEEDASSRFSSAAGWGPEDGGGGRVSGAIDLRFSATVAELTDHVHLLPCSIKHDGPCPVHHYFKPNNTDLSVDGLNVKEACFRGRKLQGATVPLPQGYRGYVLGKKKMKEGKSSVDEDEEFSHWVSLAQFGNLNYWNHDSLPSKDDPLIRCFHWFSVANAIHRPVTAEEMDSASSYQGSKV